MHRSIRVSLIAVAFLGGSCHEDRRLGDIVEGGAAPGQADGGHDGPAPGHDGPSAADAPVNDAPGATHDVAVADAQGADGRMADAAAHPDSGGAPDAPACDPNGPLCGVLPTCTRTRPCPGGEECRIPGNSCSGCCAPAAHDAGAPSDARAAVAPSCGLLPACTGGATCECCPAPGARQNCLCTTSCTSDPDCPSTAPHCSKSPDGTRALCTPEVALCCWLCV